MTHEPISQQLQMQVESLVAIHKDKDKSTLLEQYNSALSNRPLEVALRVNNAFKNVSGDSMSRFMFDGSNDDYTICNIRTQDFVSSMLKDYSSKGIDHFSFMDLGAGKHGCATYIADYINNNHHLFPNIKHVEIISLSGDNSFSFQENIGICRVSKIAGFKVEEVGRWLNPSDELIKTYEKLSENSKDCKQFYNQLSEISRIINSRDSFLIKKIMNMEDIYQDDFPNFSSSRIKSEQSIMEVLKNKLTTKIEIYNESTNKLQQEHKVDLSLDFSSINDKIDSSKYVTKMQKIIKDLTIKIDAINFAQNLNIDAAHDLKRLQELKKFNLPNQVDYATSSWCLRHLVDPVDTFKQLYDCLTPRTGILHADGFSLGIMNKEKNIGAVNSEDYNKSVSHISSEKFFSLQPMLELLHNTKVPYIFDNKDTAKRRFGGFVMNRTSSEPLKLNFKYKTFYEISSDPDINCGQFIIIDTGKKWVSSKEMNEPLYFRDTDYGKDLDIIGRAINAPNGKLNSLSMISAESSLLLEKLHNEGLNPGVDKLTAKQISQLSQLNKQEYPEKIDIGTPHESLISQYAVYKTIKEGNYKEIEKIITTHPNLINHHALILTTQKDSAENFQLILNHLHQKTENIDGFLIDSFTSAVKNKSQNIIDLYLNKNDKISPMIIFNMMQSAFTNENNELTNKIAATYPESMQEVFNLALKYKNSKFSEFIHKTQNVKIKENNLNLILQQVPSFKKSLLTTENISKEALYEINDVSKIKLLLSTNSQNVLRYVDFTELAKIDDIKKLKMLVSENVKELYYNDYRNKRYDDNDVYAASFEQLNKIDNPEKLKILTSDKVKKLCEHYDLNFSQLMEFDEKKLNLIISNDIKKLCSENKPLFSEIIKLDSAQIKEKILENKLINLGALEKSEFVEKKGTTEGNADFLYKELSEVHKIKQKLNKSIIKEVNSKLPVKEIIKKDKNIVEIDNMVLLTGEIFKNSVRIVHMLYLSQK